MISLPRVCSFPSPGLIRSSLFPRIRPSGLHHICIIIFSLPLPPHTPNQPQPHSLFKIIDIVSAASFRIPVVPGPTTVPFSPHFPLIVLDLRLSRFYYVLPAVSYLPFLSLPSDPILPAISHKVVAVSISRSFNCTYNKHSTLIAHYPSGLPLARFDFPFVLSLYLSNCYFVSLRGRLVCVHGGVTVLSMYNHIENKTVRNQQYICEPAKPFSEP